MLWFVSGGSCVPAQVNIMQQLVTSHAELANLTILPVDERFGAYGHSNSNSEQMRQAGFKPGAATWVDVLEKNLPFDETVDHYSKVVHDALCARTVIATLGMGPDGHTAGLLPDSAAIEDTVSTVIGYNWSDYTRMTTGIAPLLKINTVYVLAYGESKQTALTRLRTNTEPLEILPAKLLYDIPSVTVYNDYITTEE